MAKELSESFSCQRQSCVFNMVWFQPVRCQKCIFSSNCLARPNGKGVHTEVILKVAESISLWSRPIAKRLTYSIHCQPWSCCSVITAASLLKWVQDLTKNTWEKDVSQYESLNVDGDWSWEVKTSWLSMAKTKEQHIWAMTSAQLQVHVRFSWGNRCKKRSGSCRMEQELICFHYICLQSAMEVNKFSFSQAI